MPRQSAPDKKEMHKHTMDIVRNYGRANVERWLDQYYLNALESKRRRDELCSSYRGYTDPLED